MSVCVCMRVHACREWSTWTQRPRQRQGTRPNDRESPGVEGGGVEVCGRD